MLKRTVRVESLVLLVAAYVVLFANRGWWAGALAGRSPNEAGAWLFALALGVLLLALHYILFVLPATSRTARVWLTICVLVAMAAQYYIVSYRVLIDATMMQNVLNTDTREASELLGWRPLLSILLPAAPAIWLIWWLRLESRSWQKAAVWRVGSVAAAMLLAVVAVLPVNRDFTSLMRNERGLRYLATPANVFYGLAFNFLARPSISLTVRAAVGEDARLLTSTDAPQRPMVFVLVIGETARAANFSLLGYQRDTNPELATRDIIAFQDVIACGTSTEISLPCMFSPWGRRDYDEQQIRGSEGLLDVLVHAGFRVVWRENQSGCKGVCSNAQIENQLMLDTPRPDVCDAKHCLDEVLLDGLDGMLRDARGNTVLVMHQLGQHGPAYFERFPDRLKRFKPTCDTAELRRCTPEQVVNTYDNGILYTDEVLARLIDKLAAQSATVDSAMVFVSDHGESLGEKGLYLHGMPYAIAPQVQLKVPMVFWASTGFRERVGLNYPCLAQRAREPASHDNLFHSVLGVLDVQTSVYARDRDVFAGCRVR